MQWGDRGWGDAVSEMRASGTLFNLGNYTQGEFCWGETGEVDVYIEKKLNVI